MKRLKMLLSSLKRHKPHRKRYRIKPTIRFHIDDEDFGFAFLPTIAWMPWIFRHPGEDGVVTIWWLNFYILIGTWEKIEED